ncbi:ABC transporter substrate-binding protein [Desulfobacterales bacterium HSG2]|nr:ABC transporter substrate-binding protein [Desulfobacterales bacterium HSG2]
MKKRMRIVFATLMCSLFFSVLADAKEPIHIGLSAPMTGQYAGYGEGFKNATDLAADRINNAGGIDGRPVEVIVRDSQGDPRLAKRVARKFAEDKRIVATVGDITSSCCMSAQSIYQRAKLVQLSPTASHPSFAPGSPFSFGINGIQSGRSQFMARTLVSVFRKKRVAVIYLNNDWGVMAQKFFVGEAEKLGLKITGVESYFEGTEDFRLPLEKLRKENPEVLFLFSMYEDGALICKERQEIGWNDGAVIGSDTLHSPKFIRKAGASSENVYMFTSFFQEAPDTQIQAFVKGYQTRFNISPDITAALSYDAMNILAKAATRGGTDRKAIRDALTKITNFPGITGEMTFDEHGNVEKTSSILQVKNGKFVLFSGK